MQPNGQTPRAGSSPDKTTLFLLVAALAGAFAIHLGLEVPLGVSLLLFFVGWPLIGTLVTIDDDLRGGWSNPDGNVRPPWQETLFWGQLSAGLAFAIAGFGVDAGWRSAAAVPLWSVALGVAFAAAALLTARRWLLVGSVISAALLVLF